ncbi:MAG TPA: AraC family transcriptional regulator [Chitinophagaceae bacterium]|nr:AraC family transcriptional regulator [Chitinophagaceae bacterium]
MLILQKGNFLGNIQYLYSTGGATVSATGYAEGDICADSMHYHEHPNIYFILNGGSTEKKHGKETELRTGSLRFYYAGEQHRNIRTACSESINIEIETSLLLQEGLTEAYIREAAYSVPCFKSSILKIFRELKSTAPSAACLDMLLLELIALAQKEDGGNARPPWTATLRDFLNDCWDEPFTLQQLSDVVKINPISISKHFPRHFGCTLSEYTRRLKVDRAIALVKQKELPLTDIAYSCGFADQSHFIRVFKSQTGYAPGEYRKVSL